MIQQTAISFEDTATAFAHKNDVELQRSYWLFKSMNYRILVRPGTLLTNLLLRLRIPFIRKMVKQTLFGQFCGGETPEECNLAISKLSNAGVGTILDYAVEGATTEIGYDATERETLANIKKASLSLDIPFCVFKVTGLAPTPILAKLHANQPLTDAETAAFERVKARVDRICQAAYENGVRLFIDAEESWIQQPVDEMVYEMMAKYNQERVIVYNTYQMYLKRKDADLRRAYQLAVRDRFYLGAKLVRGAYMEKERERAEQKGYPDPIHPNKDATDTAFDKALKFCMQHKQRIAICAGTHNEYSNYYLTVLMNKYNVANNDPNVFYAQLYGMSDNISMNLSSQGYNVAKYVPYGPVEAVLPYLFRRAEENTAIAGQSSREFELVNRELKRRKRIKA